jgi:undecaprenyl-diphosphatase
VKDLDHLLLTAVYTGNDGPWLPILTALTFLGSGWSLVLLIPLAQAPATRRFARSMAAAVAVQACLVWLIKRLVGRVRPWLAMGLPAPLGVPRDGSFPSGHAAGSFCAAAFLAVVLRSSGRSGKWSIGPLVSCVFLTLACLIALSRVALGAHFPSDVVAGACLGGLVGAAAGRLHVRSEGPSRQCRPAGDPRSPLERPPHKS